MPKSKKAEDIALVSFEAFRRRAKGILSNTKKQSDAQLAALHAANIKKREAKKKH